MLVILLKPKFLKNNCEKIFLKREAKKKYLIPKKKIRKIVRKTSQRNIKKSLKKNSELGYVRLNYFDLKRNIKIHKLTYENFLK